MANGSNQSIVHLTIPVHKIFLTAMAILWTGVLVLSLALIRVHVNQTDATALRVQLLENSNERRGQKLDDVDERLQRIEQKLDRIERWVK